MSSTIEPKKRKVWRWVLAVPFLWFALTWGEDKLIDRMDRMIRADRGIFEDYVERLPNPIEFTSSASAGMDFCEHPRAWGLWRYEVCLGKLGRILATSSNDECPSPNFTVNYQRPNPILLPNMQG